MAQKDFDYHTHLIILIIENDRHVNEPVCQAIDKAREMARNGKRISKEDILAFPELFALRVRANRRVIDLEGFYPSKMEMDEALEIAAENIYDDVVAFEDITNPDFYC